MKNLTEQSAWLALGQQHKELGTQHMRDWFAADVNRFDRYSIQSGEILLDYSRNRINDATMQQLVELANSMDLKNKIAAMFAGKQVNLTEQRPALHTALRKNQTMAVDADLSLSNEIAHARQHLFNFVDDIHAGRRTGKTGKPFKNIVNIGIGGSYLGPAMCTQALKDYAVAPYSFHFMSTVDPDHVRDILNEVDPETTLFIISSKSFTTIETLTNARTVMAWLADKLGGGDISAHLAAVTAKRGHARQFGIPDENIFTFWDWVGGRYSIWSAIGLPLVLMLGKQQFNDFLQGAEELDDHFQHAPFAENIPVVMALLSIWYSNFFHATSQAIVPYSHRLRSLVGYIQQLDMESNGKSVALNGSDVPYTTGPVIFGEEGCNGQHSFYQLLHQGRHLIPMDFIIVAKPHHHASQTHHDIVLASALSQAYAFMRGKSAHEAQEELAALGLLPQQTELLASHLVIEGNKPCNLLMLQQLTPKSLGALIAVYEHKIFVQSAIWNINPFDQWGVELGKKNLPMILQQISDADNNFGDPVTTRLIKHFKKLRDMS